MSSPGCDICRQKPAPHRHPRNPAKYLCSDCKELMDFAVDLAAKQGAGRVGDIGERAAIRAGRMTKGGRGGGS